MQRCDNREMRAADPRDGLKVQFCDHFYILIFFIIFFYIKAYGAAALDVSASCRK